MDVVRIVGSAMGCIKALVNLLDKSSKLAASLAVGLDFIELDLDMIKGHLEEDKELHQQPRMQLKLQELAYDIDDFIHGLWIPGSSGGFVLSATGLDPRPEHIERIEFFKSRVKILKEELARSSEPMKSSGSATASGSPSYAPEKDLVGIAKPKQDIVDLLSRGDGALRVISIVGCTGLGKTALARALYEDEDVVNKFDYAAWVPVSDNSPADILHKIMQLPDLEPSEGSTSQGLRHFPKNRRYLVFIDDVQRGGIEWDHIEDVFRKNNMGSRIILTTRVRSVATACSSGGYMYTMKCLGTKESEELLWRKPKKCLKAPVVNLDKGSENIFLKCGGLPLALVSTGKYLSEKGQNLKRDDWENVGKVLGRYLVSNEEAFLEIKRSLVQCYDNLPDYDHRNCLLYISMFPRGHQINNKSLVRKLIAEELVAEDVCKCLEKLIDKSMIEEVLFQNDSKVAVERCKVHSIMLEFTIKKAVSRNLVSLIHTDKVQHNTHGSVRRLTVQSSPDEGYSRFPVEFKLSSLRSLTIFHSGNASVPDSGILDFRSYKMMRVLDLEGCSWLCRTTVDDICDLVFLKYLSLRNTGIGELPREVKKLKCLETLDIRGTEVNELLMEVIMLPQLAFLFGKFEVPQLGPKHTRKLEKFLQKESKLHTLAGIVIKGTNGFEVILLQARTLKKVKIWFKVDTSLALVKPAPRHKFAPFLGFFTKQAGSNLEATNNVLADSLVSCLEKRFLDLESLSIDFDGLCKDFLGYIHASCTISSIKLWGKLKKLPEPDMLSQLRNLSKLHLFSTGLGIEALAALQKLAYLEYLKLAEDRDGSWNGKFEVQANGFASLHLLCFEAPNLPKMQFDQGSMASLNSLQLLCPESPAESPRGVEDISHLANLNEVILHNSAPDATMEAWKVAALLHINRPHVKKQQEPNNNTL